MIRYGWIGLAALAAVGALAQAEVATVYLTWQRDPTTTMTVQWHTVADQTADVDGGARPGAGGAVRCRPSDDPEAPWREAEGASIPMPGTTDRFVHTAEFEGLTPDTLYDFQVVGDGRLHRFRTMPAANTRTIRFSVCGDMYKLRGLLDLMFRRIGEREVDFAVFGGDLAYASGDESNAKRWASFFDSMQANMVGEGGRLVPIIPLLGNHEVSEGGFNQTPEQAPFFFSLFAFPGKPGYGVLDFGKYLSIVGLDTQHVNPVDGDQLAWLIETLKARQDVEHLAAIYHVPAWPSARSLSHIQNRRVREAWVPVFEEYGVDFCFEHHEHAYKRTHPIREGRIDPTGIVYFGDGGFATGENRVPKSPGNWLSGGRWYLAKSGSENHFFLVSIDGPVRTFDAINAAGRVFDSYTMIDGVPAPVSNNASMLDDQNLLWVVGGVALLLLLVLHSRTERLRRELRRATRGD